MLCCSLSNREHARLLIEAHARLRTESPQPDSPYIGRMSFPFLNGSTDGRLRIPCIA
jgi:hypothetical protein